ncbi:unnamed protein product [Fusarium fujikuroi]|nr:unnamed protein product [Fusarium fujikuroi]VTT69541.1 unnamed protein product [Fusarium fujikuroi]VZH93187.1 unnamed protein product [Fusarium fujikuroi]
MADEIDTLIRHRVDRLESTVQILVKWTDDDIPQSWEREDFIQKIDPQALYTYWEDLGGRKEVTGLQLYHIFKVKAKGWAKGEIRYHCQWVGYSPKEDRWEPEEKVVNYAPAALADWKVREAARRARVAARKAAAQADNQVCRRSFENILPRLHGNEGNDSIIRYHLECCQDYLSHGGEDEHLHPFCYLECTSLEYRPMPGFYPRREHAYWGTGGWSLERSYLDTLRRRILPYLIDLSDDAGKEQRVGELKYSPLASPWPKEDFDRLDPDPLHPVAIEIHICNLKPFQLEELYSLHCIDLRKFSGDHNMGHEEAHKEAYKRTSEQYWEWKERTPSEAIRRLAPTGRDEAIIARSEAAPDSESESESEDGMDIDEPEYDDGDIAWSPVDEMMGQEVYDEPEGQVQRSRKRYFDDDDDDDEANHGEANKRARFTHW